MPKLITTKDFLTLITPVIEWRRKCFIKIETATVKAPANYPFKKRPMVTSLCYLYFMDAHTIVLKTITGTETQLINYAKSFREFDDVFYNSRNRFDEMVLRGRFPHARTRLLDQPGDWPNVNDYNLGWSSVYNVIRSKPVKPCRDPGFGALRLQRDVVWMVVSFFDIKDERLLGFLKD